VVYRGSGKFRKKLEEYLYQMKVHWRLWKKQASKFLCLVRGTIDLQILNFYNSYAFPFSIETRYFYRQIEAIMVELSESEKYLFLYKLQLIDNAYKYIEYERLKDERH